MVFQNEMMKFQGRNLKIEVLKAAAAQRGKFARKVHKPPLGVNINR